MLRLALIENLRRVTTRLMVARQDRNLADLWVERLQEMAKTNLSHLVVVVAGWPSLSFLLQCICRGILPAPFTPKPG